MFNKRDDIKTFLVIASVCIICVIIALIISRKSNFEKLEPVNEYNVYFSNVNYINNFISNIASDNNEAVYDLLDNKYIEKNNINTDNVLDVVGDYSILSSFSADSMSFVQVKDNFIYYVKGSIYESGYDESRTLIDDDFSVIISTDSNNTSFSLYLVNNRNYKGIINNIKNVNIINNGNNNISKLELINKESVCAIYLTDFVNNISMDIEKSYDLLSDDMKKIYTSIDSFKEYIGNNFNLITTSGDKCKLDNIEDNRVYTVIDSNNNTYVFTEETIMNYKVDFYFKES